MREQAGYEPDAGAADDVAGVGVAVGAAGSVAGAAESVAGAGVASGALGGVTLLSGIVVVGAAGGVMLVSLDGGVGAGAGVVCGSDVGAPGAGVVCARTGVAAKARPASISIFIWSLL